MSRWEGVRSYWRDGLNPYGEAASANIQQRIYGRMAADDEDPGYFAYPFYTVFVLLPLVFTGIGALALIIANAYLLSREFFEMIAMRHMTVDEARQLRKINTPRILAAGFAPAILSVIPVVNLVVPLFATSYFTHIFKQVRASSP